VRQAVDYVVRTKVILFSRWNEEEINDGTSEIRNVHLPSKCSEHRYVEFSYYSKFQSDIYGSHEHETYYHLGCDAVQFGRKVLTFQSNLLRIYSYFDDGRYNSSDQWVPISMRGLENVNFAMLALEGGRDEKGEGASTVYWTVSAYVSSQVSRISEFYHWHSLIWRGI
jgi:hypothetical protein